jgi:hypothetical protein
VETHPKAEQVAGFLEGRPGKTQARELVLHLLRGCSECAASTEELLHPKQALPPSAYDCAFEKAYAKVQAHRALPRPLPRLAIRQGAVSLPGAPI